MCQRSSTSPRRRPRALHADPLARPHGRAFRGYRRHRRNRARRHVGRFVATHSISTFATRGSRSRAGGWPPRPRSTPSTSALHLHAPEPLPPGPLRVHLGFAGEPQRPAPRLLPQHLHRRAAASSRCSPPPSSRPPTPGGPSPAGTSPSSRRRSPSRSIVDRRPAGGVQRARGATSRLGDGRRRVEFADTMPMSTYLVAFVVGPLRGHRAGRRRRHAAAGRRPTRRQGAPRRRSRSRSAAFCLRYFAEYYGIAVPGDKLDLVAIPDFAFGAMENLGCVTFRETAAAGRPARRPRSPSCSASSTSSPTSSRTCGSATS